MLIGHRPETARADALSNRGIGKDAHGGPAIERDDTAVLLGCHPGAVAEVVELEGGVISGLSNEP